MSPSMRDPSSIHLLIVEDEPRLRELLLKVTVGWNYSASAARSAEEASRMIKNGQTDLLLLDLHLPGENGIDFLQRLRDEQIVAPAIVLTGYGDLDSARRAIHLDVVDFLSKPCRLGELEIALDRARRRLGFRHPIAADTEPGESPAPIPTLEDVERRHILEVLKCKNGNRTTTAQELGISRRTLQYRLQTYQQQGWLSEEDDANVES